METLSDRVKKRRSELNLTQAGLAEISGTKQQTIQQVESGLTKRPRKLIELATALQCEPSWLLFGEQGNKTNAA
ncbi:helix-turn-helix domain-containing protein [Raoultella planticola]|uniref:Transcriptional repressor DicA n=1 Tax=Raoultella planticola TaxID=575 RepID=A0A485A681_RAOPL|nr:helix-turn-helix domain-containing protein [Raoultella planticola]KFD04289.1 DNA-binding repressor [Raoultella planticola ATCC 33531]MDV1192114.1 helix-turn-helix domain-containing protein [Raoultella planticola]VFS56070.1 transcriptional repressor DicA [Raoultella planticola]